MLNKLKQYTRKGKSNDKGNLNEEEPDYSFKKYFVNWKEKMEGILKQNISINNKDDSDSIINKAKERESCSEIFNECPHEELLSVFAYLKQINNNIEYNTPHNTDENNQNKEKPSEATRLIDELFSQVKFFQKKLYNPIYKKNIMLITYQITIDLFVIYLIMKRNPFSLYPRDKIEYYLTQFLPFKNWPSPAGNIGFLIYTHLINELYLPGLSMLNEIRELYFLSFIDPNKFILKQDDFLIYFSFGFESFNTKLINAFDNEYKGLIKETSTSKDKSSLSNQRQYQYTHRQEASKASLDDFDSLTIIHLLIFCEEMFHSYQNKIPPEQIRTINNYFIKAIPEYKLNGNIELQLITKNAKDKTIKETLIPIITKNLSRNVNNKNLFNSFCNVIDQGIHLQYRNQFVPLVEKMLLKLNIETVTEGEGTNRFLNLTKFIRPRIYQLECKQESFNVINWYQKIYLQLQRKYLEHLSLINIKDFKFTNEQRQQVEKFNLMSEAKLEMVRTKIQLKYIVTENYLHLFLMTVFKNLNDNFNSQKQIDYDNKASSMPMIDIQIPSLKYFLNNIIIYLFPNENTTTSINELKPQGNCLFDYFKQRDIIYHLINLNKEIKSANHEEGVISEFKSKMVNTYLSEAQYTFDLAVYRIKASNNERFFYSKAVIETMNSISIELNYDDDTIDKVTIEKGESENLFLPEKKYVKIVRIDKDNLYGNNNDNDTYMLDIFVYEDKWDINDKGNINKEKDRIYFQSICESYRANWICINNKKASVVYIDIDDMGKVAFEGEIDISPVYFDTFEKERFKIKIATFVDINSN